MSRKQHPKDPSGFVFDVRSGAVRAQGGCSENMKEKVQAVRAVVPNRSNTEIVLVLQHFDNAVERAVHAFVEGNASEVLKEWTVTGKKKNKKKKPKAKAPPGPSPAGKSRQENWEKLGNSGISINGFHGNDSESLESLSEAGAAPAPPQSPEAEQGRKLGSSLEKSLKDLQRCSVALARFRALLRDEVETSLRRVKGTFSELQGCLMDREVALLAEMDKVKAEAMELLSLRQRRAEALRELTEAAPGMSEEQLLELRADIKHFVSERKLDEELGRAGRFGCDLDALRGSIGAFGQVSHPRPSYSSRSRCGSGPASGSTPAFPTGSSGSAPAFPTGSTSGSAPGSSGSAPGSTPAFPTGSSGSAPAFPRGSNLGSTSGSTPGSIPAFPTGSAPGSSGSAPAFSTGSAPGSSGSAPGSSGSAPGSSGSAPAFPSGSAPGSPRGSAAPTEPPPTPQPPQRSRKPPGAAGPRPPGIPKNPKNPQNNPGSSQIPKNPKKPQNPGSGARSRPGKPRRSRPEGANS